MVSLDSAWVHLIVLLTDALFCIKMRTEAMKRLSDIRIKTRDGCKYHSTFNNRKLRAIITSSRKCSQTWLAAWLLVENDLVWRDKTFAMENLTFSPALQEENSRDAGCYVHEKDCHQQYCGSAPISPWWPVVVGWFSCSVGSMERENNENAQISVHMIMKIMLKLLSENYS